MQNGQTCCTGAVFFSYPRLLCRLPQCLTSCIAILLEGYATALYFLCLQVQPHKDAQGDLYEACAGEQPFFQKQGRNAHMECLLLGATCPWHATVHSRASSKLLPLFQQ